MRIQYKIILTIVLGIALVMLFSSCQSISVPNQDLSNKASGIEMIDSMHNYKNSGLILQENNRTTIKMMKNHVAMMKSMNNNPEMMQRMMSDMMETTKK